MDKDIKTMLKTVKKTSVVIRNCELRYVRLAVPSVDPWGSSVFELAIVTSDEGQKQSWESMKLHVKALEGDESIVNLKKYATSKDKKHDMSPPVVFDKFKNKDSIDPASVGSGTMADVRVIQYPSTMSPTGVASVLSAIMVHDLVEYDHAETIASDF